MRLFTLMACFVFFTTSCTCKKEEVPPAETKPVTQAPPSGPTFTLTGKAIYPAGNPTAEVLKMNADPACVKATAGQKVTSESIVVSSDKRLANVFVYVKEGAAASSGGEMSPVVFDQRGCRYAPHVVGLRVNQTLKILNSDPTLHNVNAQGKANSGFNAGMPTQGQVLEKKFTKPEVMVRVKCDVHGWMSAYIGVLDHPYFAVTDASGNFSIANLPAGTYTVEAWHEKLGTKTQQVVVAGSAPAPVEFKF